MVWIFIFVKEKFLHFLESSQAVHDIPLIKPVKSEWYRYSIWIENSNSNEGFEWDLCPPCFPKLALKPQPIIDVTMVVVDEAQGHHNHKSKYDFNPSSSHGGGSSFKNRLLHRYTTTYTDTYLLCTVWLIMGRCHFWKRTFMNQHEEIFLKS